MVIGAGAIGASAALHLARAGARVLVLEKEDGPAQHQSGRNSGVIHAGYNLKPGSLKAKYCVEGSRRLREFCRERKIPIAEDGILIVARTIEERATIQELHRRAKANGVQSSIVDEAEIQKLEPHAFGIEGLHAPEGASFDSVRYVTTLLEEARRAGASVQYDVDARQARETASSVTVKTTKGAFNCGVVLNCGGLQADRLAGSLASAFRIIPFRGYYAELVPERRSLVRSHIYAVPDLTFPFLGAHLSRRTDGRVIVGPGAMLAFGRESYNFATVHFKDFAETLAWPGFWRLFKQRRFVTLIRSEVRKSLSLRSIWEEVRLIVAGIQPQDLIRSFAGNRAQLVDRAGNLIDDITVLESERSVHVLNAVSPGLTCSLPFGEALAQTCVAHLRN